MTAGSAYAIVVDGYGGKYGQYQIDIVAQQVQHTPIASAFQHFVTNADTSWGRQFILTEAVRYHHPCPATVAIFAGPHCNPAILQIEAERLFLRPLCG